MRCPKDGLIGIVKSFSLLSLALVLAYPIFSQVAGGTLSGSVTDASGASVADAQLTIRDVSTGITRNVATNSSGYFTAPNLLPSTYEITATAPGFSTEIQSGITLTVGAEQVVTFVMRVGQVSTKVEVVNDARSEER